MKLNINIDSDHLFIDQGMIQNDDGHQKRRKIQNRQEEIYSAEVRLFSKNIFHLNNFLLSQLSFLLYQPMFPVANQDSRFVMFNPTFSPANRQHSNQSTHLPYFKRFANSKFFSQQRKRKDRIPEISPQAKVPQLNVMTKQSYSFIDRKQKQEKGKVFSTSILKTDKASKNKKLIRQFFERETNKSKPKTEISQEKRKSSFLKPRAQIQTQNNEQFSSVLDIMKNSNSNSLKLYEKEELVNYTHIYYFGQKCKKKHMSLQQFTKKDGSYNWIEGDHINFRYQLIQMLGEGSFGEVFKCFDHKLKKMVALKIVKNNQKYLKQAKTQIKILQRIKTKDPSSTKNCVHLKDYFEFRKRICMVFDLMSINLYELIKNNGYYGLPLDLLRRMALQILNGIHFLHKNQIIHADLKPENILLKETNKSGIKIIDFGSSCFEKQTIYTYIQSRYYRAPEVILGIPYNRKIDIWSFACIIAELYLGYPLFAGDEEHQQLCLIIEILGLPNIYPNTAKRWEVFFDDQNQLKNHPKKVQPASKQLSVALENPEDRQFVNFINKCLSWSVQERPQALQCLKHEWILKGLPEQIKLQHLKFIQDEEKMKQNEGHRKINSFSIQQRNKLFS